MLSKKMKFHRKLIQVFILGYIWIIATLCIFSGFLYHEYGQSIRKTGNKMLELYEKELENILILSGNDLLNILFNNSYAKLLKLSSSDVKKYSAAYELRSILYNQMSLQPGIVGFQILYNDGGDCLYTYRETVSHEDKKIIKKYVMKQLTQGQKMSQWKIIYGNKKNYLLFTSGDCGVYLSVIVDFETIAAITDMDEYSDNDVAIIFCDNVKVLSNAQTASDLGIINAGNIHNEERMKGNLLLSRKINQTDLTIMVSILYWNTNVWIIAMIIVLLIITMTVVCVIFSYSSINKLFILPLNAINQTILKINDGNMDIRMSSDMAITEYAQISMSFNDMMDQIKSLKIQAYEEQIKEQYARFQYLQLQIKPHFFLNCLKIFYALSQQKKYQNLENIIIDTSKYFRYIFRNNFDLVTIREELDFTRNYLMLQKNSAQLDIDYSFEVKDELLEERGIPLMIQTFVENTIKYAKPAEKLILKVKIICLKGEDDNYLNIIITDNGAGYSPEWLDKINQVDYNSPDGNHVGILNLKQRLQLRFGKNAEIIVRNHNGAISEVIYPLGNTLST
ncbi:MAG TPA: histidine kinase [Clostridiales bacterium]|nr:histidine kinase [Clostridiales bacterium]